MHDKRMDMRVLIISHNVISETGNMGKTIRSYFTRFEPGEVAQFYIQNEIPEDFSICRNYYRFTDSDAVHSVFSPSRRGTICRRAAKPSGEASGEKNAFLKSAYRFGKKKGSSAYAVRNFVWNRSRWKNEQFRKWILEFDPDVIFFMSGDYAFMYDIARYASDCTGKPLAVVCVDDYYRYNRNAGTWAGRREFRKFMEKVRETMKRAGMIFTICEPMSRDYAELFGKECRTLYTSAASDPVSLKKGADRISYIGNLDNGRHLQLASMGRALKQMNRDHEPKRIDVYSGESRPEILSVLSEENGIRFHGRIGPEEVRRVMAGSLAVIHTESFEEKYKRIVHYSVSTKIADTLMNGPCLIAYGPKGIASMDYLADNRAAFVITEESALKDGLERIITDHALREEILHNARCLAEKNHSPEKNGKMLRSCLEEICEKGRRHEDSAD